MRSFVLFAYISDKGPATERTVPRVSYMQTPDKLSNSFQTKFKLEVEYIMEAN